MYLLNMISICFTYSLILVGLSENIAVKQFCKLFVLSIFIYLSFYGLGFEKFTNIPLAYIVAFCSKEKGSKYPFSLLKSLSVILWYSFFVMVIGSGFFALAPDFMATINFNILMSILSIIFGVISYFTFRNRDLLGFLCLDLKVVRVCVLIETTLLLFMMITPIIGASERDSYNWFAYYLLHSVATAFVFYLFYRFSIMQNKLNYTIGIQRLEEINRQIIEEKHNDIVRIKHYYNNLYSSMGSYLTNRDLEGLSAYFEKYISPIHESHIKNSNTNPKLELVENTLIRNLLFDAFVKAKQIYNVQIDFEITSIIKEFYIKEIDLFIILNEWINNAFQSKSDSVLVSVSKSDFAITIKIINPIFEDIDLSKITQKGYTTKENHHGIGLFEVEKISSAYTNIEHMTFIEFSTFVQCLIIRKS